MLRKLLPAVLAAVLCLLAFLTIAVLAHADAPAAFKLGPEASKAFVQIQGRLTEIEKEHAELTKLKLALLVGAEVAPEARASCAAGQDGVVVCSKPAPTPSPTPAK